MLSNVGQVVRLRCSISSTNRPKRHIKSPWILVSVEKKGTLS